MDFIFDTIKVWIYEVENHHFIWKLIYEEAPKIEFDIQSLSDNKKIPKVYFKVVYKLKSKRNSLSFKTEELIKIIS